MRYLLICILLIGSCISVGAQVKRVYKNRELTCDDIRSKYALAMDLKDYQTAKEALVQLLAVYPSDTNTLIKLLWVYFEVGNKEACYELSKKYLDKYRTNRSLLDFLSRSSQVLGKYVEALEGYEKLFVLTNDIYYGYYAANMEYLLGRKNECLERINNYIEKRPQYEQQRVYITFDLDSGNKKTVDVYAAFYNLKGVILMQDGNSTEAKVMFNKAVEITPDFSLAIQNLNDVQSK